MLRENVLISIFQSEIKTQNKSLVSISTKTPMFKELKS